MLGIKIEITVDFAEMNQPKYLSFVKVIWLLTNWTQSLQIRSLFSKKLEMIPSLH